ncbi:MAG: DUF3800 domain-containing protein [Candidatus Nitrosotenuis sp.]
MIHDTIYVDESGNAGLTKKDHIGDHPYFIVGFAYVSNPYRLKIKMKRLIKRLHQRNKYAPELKEIKFNPTNSLKRFGYSDDEINAKWKPHYNFVRLKTSEIISNNVEGVFAGILDKRTVVKQTWTTERIGNYLFNQSLFYILLPKLGLSVGPSIIFDKGRLSPDRTKAFNEYMLGTDSYLSNIGVKKYNGNIVNFKDINSLDEPGIWIADHVAGAFHFSLKHNDNTFYNLLKPKFVGSGCIKLWF